MCSFNFDLQIFASTEILEKKNDTILGTANNDFIKLNWSSFSTVNAEAGNDTVEVNDGAGYVSINSGDGNDLINLKSDEYFIETIRAGKGNDTVYGNGKTFVYQYEKGDGNDLIFGWTSNATLKTSENFSTLKSGEKDLIVNIGSGSITLVGAFFEKLNIDSPYKNNRKNIYNSKRVSIISGSDYDDTINNFHGDLSMINSEDGNDLFLGYNTRSANISLGSGEDTLEGSFWSSEILGGTGADNIRIFKGCNNSVNAGDGNDTIISEYGGSLDGGAGSDIISIKSSDHTKTTLSGGKGNDTIFGDEEGNDGIIFKYAEGDGDDIIFGYKSADTIQIVSGQYDDETVGNDVLIHVGANTITLAGAKWKEININGNPKNKNGLVIENYVENSLVSGSHYNDTIKNYAGGVTIDARTGNDFIWNSTQENHTTEGSFGFVTITGGEGNDTIYSKDPYTSINSGTGNDSIYNWGRKNTIESGTGKDTVYNYDGDFSSINTGEGNDSIFAFDNDRVTLDTDLGNDTISGNYYRSVIQGNEGADDIKIYGGFTNTIDAGAGNDTIYAYSGSINGGLGNDRISIGGFEHGTVVGGEGNDTIFSENIYDFGNIYRYSKGDGNDVIFGYKDNDTILIGGETFTKSTVGADVVIKIGSGQIILKDSIGKKINVKKVSR